MAAAAISLAAAEANRVFTWVLGQSGAASVKQEDAGSQPKTFAAGDTGPAPLPISGASTLARGLLFWGNMNAQSYQVQVELTDRKSGETTMQRAFPSGEPAPDTKRYSAAVNVQRGDGQSESHWVYVTISAGRRVRVAGGARTDDPDGLEPMTATLHEGKGSLSYGLMGRYDVRVEILPKVASVPPPARNAVAPRSSNPPPARRPKPVEGEGLRGFFEKLGLEPKKKDERVIVRRVARVRW